MGVIGKILRAAVHKPWEDEDESPVTGLGAPEEFEFRVRPDGEVAAVWAPRVGKWMVFSDVVVLEQEPLLTRRFDHWHQFLEVDLDLDL